MWSAESEIPRHLLETLYNSEQTMKLLVWFLQVGLLGLALTLSGILLHHDGLEIGGAIVMAAVTVSIALLSMNKT
jgi:hypothetical protein